MSSWFPTAAYDAQKSNDAEKSLILVIMDAGLTAMMVKNKLHVFWLINVDFMLSSL